MAASPCPVRILRRLPQGDARPGDAPGRQPVQARRHRAMPTRSSPAAASTAISTPPST
ncbi:MAG: hypothetical protein WDN06_05380 [Asticcacaulis sp.]